MNGIIVIRNPHEPVNQGDMTSYMPRKSKYRDGVGPCEIVSS